MNNNSGLAVASMVLGIISISLTILCSCFVPFVPAICGIISIPLGTSALADSELNSSDKSKAKAGIITSIISIVIQLVLLLVIIFCGDWHITPYINYTPEV